MRVSVSLFFCSRPGRRLLRRPSLACFERRRGAEDATGIDLRCGGLTATRSLDARSRSMRTCARARPIASPPRPAFGRRRDYLPGFGPRALHAAFCRRCGPARESGPRPRSCSGGGPPPGRDGRLRVSPVSFPISAQTMDAQRHAADPLVDYLSRIRRRTRRPPRTSGGGVHRRTARRKVATEAR